MHGSGQWLECDNAQLLWQVPATVNWQLTLRPSKTSTRPDSGLRFALHDRPSDYGTFSRCILDDATPIGEQMSTSYGPQIVVSEHITMSNGP